MRGGGFSIIKGLLFAAVAAVLGVSLFLSFAIGLLYIVKLILPSGGGEAAPPLWIFLYLVVVLLGAGLTATFAGLRGYARFRQSLIQSSTP